MNKEDKKLFRYGLIVLGSTAAVGCAVGLSIGMKIGNKGLRDVAEELVDYAEHLGGNPADFYNWLTSKKK